MRLDENFTLTNDSNNWILNYEKEGDINHKTNRPTLTKETWYFGKLDQALNRYVNEATKQSEDVNDLRVQLSRIQDTINQVVLSND